MIRSRPLLLVWSALVVAFAVSGKGWVAGAAFVGAYLATAPGSVTCRLLSVPSERSTTWIMTIAISFSIDVLVTETMLYAKVWTPVRGIGIVAALTAALVVSEPRILNKRDQKLR